MPIQVDPVSDMSFQIDGSDSDMDPGFRVKMYKILNKILLFLLFNSFLSFYHLCKFLRLCQIQDPDQ